MSSTLKQIIPNLLTLSRGLFVIIISLLFFSNLDYKFPIIYLIFLLGCISDYYDGKLARKWHSKSDFGIVFDSLFDKIFTFTMYILLIPYKIIHPGIYIILVFRDLLIDGLKNYSLSKGVPISARYSGKLKMVFQTLFINFGLLLLIFPTATAIKILLFISAILAVIFSLYSGFFYIKDFILPKNLDEK